MKRPTVTCGACEGKGSAPLSRHLFATLSLFSRGQRLTAPMAHAKEGEKEGVTATNNRLEKLRGLGLLERTKTGKTFHYFLATK